MIGCEMCNGECCRYVAAEIDKPESRKDIHHIRWFLLHDSVRVCIDDEGTWYVEFQTKCRWLGADNKCLHYSKRPDICRKHGLDECERNGEGRAYDVVFRSMEEFEDYVRKDAKLSKIKWDKYKD